MKKEILKSLGVVILGMLVLITGGILLKVIAFPPIILFSCILFVLGIYLSGRGLTTLGISIGI